MGDYTLCFSPSAPFAVHLVAFKPFNLLVFMRICCVEADSPLDILEFTASCLRPDQGNNAALLVLLLLTVDLWSLVRKMKAQDSFLFEQKKPTM